MKTCKKIAEVLAEASGLDLDWQAEDRFFLTDLNTSHTILDALEILANECGAVLEWTGDLVKVVPV